MCVKFCKRCWLWRRSCGLSEGGFPVLSEVVNVPAIVGPWPWPGSRPPFCSRNSDPMASHCRHSDSWADPASFAPSADIDRSHEADGVIYSRCKTQALFAVRSAGCMVVFAVGIGRLHHGASREEPSNADAALCCDSGCTPLNGMALSDRPAARAHALRTFLPCQRGRPARGRSSTYPTWPTFPS